MSEEKRLPAFMAMRQQYLEDGTDPELVRAYEEMCRAADENDFYAFEVAFKKGRAIVEKKFPREMAAATARGIARREAIARRQANGWPEPRRKDDAPSDYYEGWRR